MYSRSEDLGKIDNQDETTTTSTTDRSRKVEKSDSTNGISHRHGEKRVLSSRPRRELIARANQDQENASCTSFYLFFSGTLLFTMAGTLLSTGAWCFLVRLPMIHLARGPSRIIVILSGYVFAAGSLTLPVSCILYREHNVTRRGRRTLLPVIIMLGFSTVILICCATHGIIHHKSYHSLVEDFTGKARLQCCGINEASDWTKYSVLTKFPPSCYSTSSDENGKRKMWKMGCGEAIALDLAWITAYVVGLCFMSLLAHGLAIVSAGILLRISRRTSVADD